MATDNGKVFGKIREREIKREKERNEERERKKSMNDDKQNYPSLISTFKKFFTH